MKALKEKFFLYPIGSRIVHRLISFSKSKNKTQTANSRNRLRERPLGKGFTLLDTVIVIMIIGIMGVIVIPKFNSLAGETKLNEAAGELVSALQYAGNLAITYQRPFCLRANAGGNWFKVVDDQFKVDSSPHHDSDPPVGIKGVVLNPFDKKWYEKDFDDMGIYEGVDITSVPQGNEVCFYPDGHSDSSENTFVLNYGGDQRTITVDGITGRITVK